MPTPMIVYVTAVNGLSSGLGATPATAVRLDFALTDPTIKAAGETAGAVDFLAMATGEYVFVESGATGDQMNAFVEDTAKPTGADGWVRIIGANAQGVVDGTPFVRRASGTWASSSVRKSMISFQPRRRFAIVHARVYCEDKAYNSDNNAGLFGNTAPDTSAVPVDMRIELRNYIGYDAYHNNFSFVGGRPGVENPCTVPGGGGLFLEDVEVVNSGITGGGFAAIVARGGTNAKVLSVRATRVRFTNCCAGIQVNADGTRSPSIVEDCVFNMNTTGTTQTGRAVQFTKADAPIQVHRSVFYKGNSYDLAIDLSLPGSVVTNCEFSGNTNVTGTAAAVWAYNRGFEDGLGARVIGCNFYDNDFGNDYVLTVDEGLIDASVHTGSTNVDPSYTDAANGDFSRSASFVAGATSGGGMAGAATADRIEPHIQLPVTPGRPRLRNRVA